MLSKLFNAKASWQLNTFLLLCDVILSAFIIYKIACKIDDTTPAINCAY